MGSMYDLLARLVSQASLLCLTTAKDVPDQTFAIEEMRRIETTSEGGLQQRPATTYPVTIAAIH